ncbi:MAG: hypothetical protein HYT73_00360 [Candidatus Aenigmarchaeota archaeon]|nr:hypothetical protein [Candidatus Aenigmarchaeota archaeon]
MGFEYRWQDSEANFGRPVNKETDGGTHITFDILLKKGNKYIALRRKNIPGHENPPEIKDHPEGLLFLCHNLIRYGESVEQCVKRIVKEQSEVNVTDYKVVDLRTVLMEESGGKKIRQWSVIPFIIAEVDKIPEPGNRGSPVSEVVTFGKDSVPDDFAWGKAGLIRKILERISV